MNGEKWDGWNDQNIKELERLHAEGLSYGTIAKRLGATRNSVCGKLHRMGLCKGVSPNAVERVSAPRREPRKPRRIPAHPRPLQLVKPPPPIALAGKHQCKWPFGDPREAGFHFCPALAIVGRPYCQKHLDKAYIATPARVREPKSFAPTGGFIAREFDAA